MKLTPPPPPPLMDPHSVRAACMQDSEACQSTLGLSDGEAPLASENICADYASEAEQAMDTLLYQVPFF